MLIIVILLICLFRENWWFFNLISDFHARELFMLKHVNKIENNARSYSKYIGQYGRNQFLKGGEEKWVAKNDNPLIAHQREI